MMRILCFTPYNDKHINMLNAAVDALSAVTSNVLNLGSKVTVDEVICSLDTFKPDLVLIFSGMSKTDKIVADYISIIRMYSDAAIYYCGQFVDDNSVNLVQADGTFKKLEDLLKFVSLNEEVYSN